jgi:hypothetical protein
MSTGIIIAGADGFVFAADEHTEPGQEEHVRMVPLCGNQDQANRITHCTGVAVISCDSSDCISRVSHALTGSPLDVEGTANEIHDHLIRTCSDIGNDCEFSLIYGGYHGTTATSGRIVFSNGIVVQDEMDTPESRQRVRALGDRSTVYRLLFGAVPAFQTLILRKIHQEAGRFYGIWLRDRERYYDSILKQIASSAGAAERTIDAELHKHNADSMLRQAIGSALDSIDYDDPLDTPFSECMNLLRKNGLETEDFLDALEAQGLPCEADTIVPGAMRYQYVDRPIKEEEHEKLWDRITDDARHISSHDIAFAPEKMTVSELVPLVHFLMSTSRAARRFLANKNESDEATLIMTCTSDKGCTRVTDIRETE